MTTLSNPLATITQLKSIQSDEFYDSIHSLFNPADSLTHDTKVKIIENNETYLFRLANEGLNKQIQHIPGLAKLAIPENKIYKD